MKWGATRATAMRLAGFLVAATVLAAAPVKVTDHVVIEKAQRRLVLFNRGAVLRTYRVSLGIHPVGAKEEQGDGRTPEGPYVIDGRNASSGFHKALHISYPNAADRERAAAKGVQLGGDIMVHGLRNGLGWLGSMHYLFDWTNGCVAVTDREIDEIWQLVPDGVPVDIVP